MKLSLLAAELGLKALPEDKDITFITDNSAKVCDGSIFVCIEGKHFDGHTKAAEALENGAAAVVVQKDMGLDRQLLVDDTRAAYTKLCAAFYSHPEQKLDIIGITGTNGKTTTTVLTSKMAGAVNSTVAAGNIGPSALLELDRHLEANTLPEVWVLELSSFQLQTTQSLACTAAAFLNLTEDHVDWHGSMQAYEEAKKRIFAPATKRILNRDDAASLRAFKEGQSVTFGDSPCEQIGQWGIEESDGIEWLAVNPLPRGNFASEKKAALFGEPAAKQLLMPVEALKIRGRHNAMNALAALALVDAAGLPLGPALQVLKDYRGEAHRVQPVLSVNGIEFIDDSKGTNVGAVKAALEGLGKSGRRVSIILGGDGKGQDFAPLAEPLAQYADFAVLIGRDADKIEAGIAGSGVRLAHAGTDFEAAVQLAFEQAPAGGVVLLSPACASWDMFANYAERSERFVKKARHIQQTMEGKAEEGGR